MRVAARITRIVGLLLLGLLMLIALGWGVLALLYWDHASPAVREGLAAAYGFGSLGLVAGFALRRWRWRAFGAFVALFAALVFSWSAIEASNDRSWQPENAVLAFAEIDGDRITLHNIRNFDYRTETDFTPLYYDRTFDLRQLERVDLFAVYWMGPAIAHLFLSFGFSDGTHVAVSIEARRERGEAYSSIQGFFRQYELYYAVGDERDIVRLRTNYRHDPPERVYLYRLQGSPRKAQLLFLEYLRRINALKQHAEWYNSLTTNCTNTIWLNARILPGHLPYSWKILLSGHVPEYLYDHDKLDTSVPFEELRRRADINARAQVADQAEDFSQQIRAPRR
ncbi:MAG TPA: DUF4105 domain-containing protein [Steroidobacteraceae bacterium]|nr:DUF4105 domain-containing protein [Steroidobacteraceae bacterium]